VVVLGVPLRASSVAAITARIASHGANIDRIRRLSRYPVTTVEFDVSGADLDRLRRELALESSVHGLDIAVAAGGLARRGRRRAVMDVDSTLIQDEVIELLSSHAGREAEEAAVIAAAMRGELDFADTLPHVLSTATPISRTIRSKPSSQVMGRTAVRDA
jgi:phosphoserine phosphatase